MRSKLSVVGAVLLALIAPRKRTHGFHVLRGTTSLYTQQTAIVGSSRVIESEHRSGSESGGRRCVRARSSVVGEDAATGGTSYPKSRPPLKVRLLLHL